MINLEWATYGAELELADVDRSIVLPVGNKWCDKDGSICNSNGTANDPKAIFNRFGGEIQVAPANSPEELLETINSLYRILNVTSKSFNFSTNLHVHIRVPGLDTDLAALKRIAEYVQTYGKHLFQMIEPNDPPVMGRYSTPEAYEGAYKRFKRRGHSHHYVVPKTVYKRMMEAQTPEQFWLAHAVKDKEGKPLWHLVVRSGVNLKQLWEDTKTIEFRHFTMSPDMDKMLSALRWPRIFLESVFADPWLTPEQIFAKHPELTFQGFWPYDYELDQIFQQTNVYHNPRPVVKENYERLIAEGKLTREELGV
jgi:hypothetical protein